MDQFYRFDNLLCDGSTRRKAECCKSTQIFRRAVDGHYRLNRTANKIGILRPVGLSATRRGGSRRTSPSWIRKLSGAAAKKIEPQFSAIFGFLLLALAFNVRSFMRQLAKAKVAPSI
jgi:hypothetical protein